MTDSDSNNSSDSRQSTRTHYEVLGVEQTAEFGQIRRAYLDAARKWHPDRLGSVSAQEASKAEAAMRRVNEAWSVLGDEQSRRAYDQQIVARTSPFGADGVGGEEDPRVVRIDPRLLDPEFLAARRDAQLSEISDRHSVVVRALPVVLVLGLLTAIFVFTAYADRGDDVVSTTTAPGPSLGAGIEANDCVDIMSGPSLLEVPCTANADGRVVGAHLGEGTCPLGTIRELELSNAVWVCLG